MSYPEKVIPILRQLRPILLPHWGQVENIGYKNTEDASTAVTKLDIEVEKIVAKKLAAIYPEIAFVGEEAGGNRTAKIFWLMDPIDGTHHYISGLPFCSSMIALIADGEVIFSAIYDFINDQVYWAERGAGAFRDSTRLQVNNLPLAESYIGWETHMEKEKNRQIYLELHKRTILLHTVSSGWEYAMIASGKLGARICFDPFGEDYDFVAGAFLVAEAGGVVTNLHSDKYDYRNTDFIAANPVIYKELTTGPDALFPQP